MSRDGPGTPRWARLWPQGLAGRFALLLVAALVVVSLVSIALLSSERQRLGRDFHEGREIDRLVSLVPLIEAVPRFERERIAGLASDRFTRVSVGPKPTVAAEDNDVRSAALARQILTELGSDPGELRVAVRHGSRRAEADDRRRPGEGIALSIRLADPGVADVSREQWLNIAARASRPPSQGDPRPFLLALLLAFAAVLAVGLLFIRRLTWPLAALAEAARAAGRGDRTARVVEGGARELRETAQAFNEMQARIARFDAERTRTLAAVGHDLRTPITSLRIRAEMLDEAERDPMVRTLDEMTVMADGLVAYARGQGDAEEPGSVDLSGLLSRLCLERGADLSAPEAVAVRGRSVALSRAFGNLVDNALRYGHAARVRLQVEDGEARVTVEDDGPGIPPERIETMFEPFVRGEASRNVETGGAGLGLSIARSIIRAHGGEVTLHNREGGGLVATVVLPVG
jgi:signal transduction histidine kinase